MPQHVPATATALLHTLGQVLTGQREDLREAVRNQGGPGDPEVAAGSIAWMDPEDVE